MLLILILLTFCIITISVARGKGLRALFSFAVSILIFGWGLVPALARGVDPIIAVCIASICVLGVIIYGTEGFSHESHLSLVSVLLISIIILPLTWLVMRLGHLDGYTLDGIEYLTDAANTHIDPLKISFAGIILGTLAILCETIITQIVAVHTFVQLHPESPASHIYERAHTIGISHMGAVINTLFLLYASTSLPIMIALTGTHSLSLSLLNNQVILIEIVRIIAGATAVVISIPLSTALGTWYFTKQKPHSLKKENGI